MSDALLGCRCMGNAASAKNGDKKINAEELAKEEEKPD
jgi:hypothetical protein